VLRGTRLPPVRGLPSLAPTDVAPDAGEQKRELR